jgi:mono/diheme cytochrome c family protein
MPRQVELGMKVYADQKCSICHSIAGKGNPKGPLDDVGSRLSADEIRQWIVTPADMSKKAKAESRMLS